MQSGIPAIFFIFTLFSLMFFTFDIQAVKASGTLYIRADGSVDPPTANITTSDNVTYTFTNNNYGMMIIEKDDIVVDGAGYTLQGTKSEIRIAIGTGIQLLERSNVTIKNTEINLFMTGIEFWNSSNNNILKNNITKNDVGVHLIYSANNSISENNITNNGTSVYLFYSANNSISGNNISTRHGSGIWLEWYCNYTSIIGNNITNNEYGIWLVHSSNNMLRNNDVSNNTYNYNVVGWLMPDCIQDIDCSNTADGKPVYYWINRRDITVPLDAGYVALINCTRITVQNLTLANNFQGIFLAFTTNSTITNNDLTNNIGGIMLVNASDNTISGNLISNSFCGISLLFTSNNTISENNILNNVYGIQLTYCEGDILYHNSLVNSSFMQVFFDETTISWDNGCEGNFWSDYNGTDSDGNGIGDTPYIIICFDETSQDNYPLMKPRNLLFGDINFDLKIDMRDIGVAAWSLGSYLGHPRWNSYADLNEDGRLDMKDLITIANNFGKTYSRIN